jgi:hypothetical protein
MSTDTAHAPALYIARAVAVLSLIVIAVDHLYEYTGDHYAAIPTIGVLFLLNAIGGFGLAAALVVPLRRLVSRRRAGQITAVLASAGIALAAGSLAALLVSESRPLFGFMEEGYRASIVIAIIAESLAVVALSALAFLQAPDLKRPVLGCS